MNPDVTFNTAPSAFNSRGVRWFTTDNVQMAAITCEYFTDPTIKTRLTCNAPGKANVSTAITLDNQGSSTTHITYLSDANGTLMLTSDFPSTYGAIRGKFVTASGCVISTTTEVKGKTGTAVSKAITLNKGTYFITGAAYGKKAGDDSCDQEVGLVLSTGSVKAKTQWRYSTYDGNFEGTTADIVPITADNTTVQVWYMVLVLIQTGSILQGLL